MKHLGGNLAHEVRKQSSARQSELMAGLLSVEASRAPRSRHYEASVQPEQPRLGRLAMIAVIEAVVSRVPSRTDA